MNPDMRPQNIATALGAARTLFPTLRSRSPRTAAVAVGLITLASLCAAPAAAQTTIVNTLSASNNGFSTSTNTQELIAQAFTTDGNFYSLVDVTIKAFSNNSGVGAYALWSNGAGQPGAPIVSLGSTPTLNSSFQEYTRTPASGTTLAANTTYWIVGFASSGTLNQLGNNPSPASTGVGSIPTDTAFAFSGNGGSNWAVAGITSGAFSVRVRGTITAAPAPEPGALALLGVGLLPLAAYRSRRARK